MYLKDNMLYENFGLYLKIIIERGINKFDEYIGVK